MEQPSTVTEHDSGSLGLKAPEVSKADSPDFSESSTSGSERRAYTRTNQSQRSTPNYLRLRSRNNEAVKRFRQKSKNQTRSLEDEISRYQKLALMYESEECRLTTARRNLETLIQRHVRGEEIARRAHDIIESVREARRLFHQELVQLDEDDERDGYS
ncbi:hypothetical protein CLF_100232 [Clonorchis sinensis]|uniref:BZIP domain-containing protein n=1 Tax=Clonorchis sinensis TaxID=79923 RepID=G7Y2Z0_CLOSI|nr:hypothetical protein CLF_100232 [Clonorchis sinensis]